MLAEEAAIWVIIFVALLLVGAIVRRGEAMPKIEKSDHDDRPDYRNFDERAWLATNRYGHDGSGQPTGPTSLASVELGPTKERALPLPKVEAPEGSPEGEAQAADAPTSGGVTERALPLPKVEAPAPEKGAAESAGAPTTAKPPQ